MASTSMTSSNALTLKLWATEDWVNPGQRVSFGHMFKRGSVHFAEEFLGQKARGDQITYDYTNKLTGIPVGEGGTLDGNEEALNLGYFSMAINVTRIGMLHPNDGTIEQQRTLVDFPERSRKLIPARHMELLDTAVFYQLAGAAPTSFTLNGTTWSGNNRLFVWGHNTPPAPSANRILRAGGAANDQSLTSSNTFTLDLIDYALEQIELSNQPIKMFADDTYDLYLSPEQYTDVKQDSSGKIQWFNQALAYGASGKYDQLEGIMFDTMPCLGQYGRVNIYMANRVAYGVSSADSSVITTVRRAVLVGKDALTFASTFGGRPSDKSVPLRYIAQLKDYEYYKGLEGRMIYGLKKTVATNSDDIGVFVIATYAAPHS
jgi:Protein of unknown function (DUF4043)